ncbi:MAG: S8 family serine peptidase, partial [Promethearchaeota archaeon]
TVATSAYNLNNTGSDIPPGLYTFNWTRFNVTEAGLIELFCEYDDYTPGLDDLDFWVYLYYGDTIVDSYTVTTDSWTHTLSKTVTNSTLGEYSFRFVLNLTDNTGDGWVSNFDTRFRSEIHWPFDPPLLGSGDPWQGIAPDTHLVGVKVLDQSGSGWSSDIINGINWVISNKLAYNITTMSLSLGGGSGQVGMINAVNNAVNNGIVTVVSAGNDGPGFNNIGSPGDADNVITVAAMSIDDEITDYSSEGGSSYTNNTIKPDITAPGGSFNNLQMFSSDTNDNDASGVYPTEGYTNDLEGAQGTSMSAPAVAGASNLLIEAMGGHQSWGYTSTEAKRVKAILLMSATETYPLLRETYLHFDSPVLNRGGKDVHEGYGRINVDVAIEAYTNELTLGSQYNAFLTNSVISPFNKHGLGCYVNLNSGEDYIFTLDVPTGADFDLHLYSDSPSSIGEPIMVDSSISTEIGKDELIAFTPSISGKYYLIAKAISGEGNATISYPFLANELSVALDVPSYPDVGNSYTVNATVYNIGNNVESNVDLVLYLDDLLVNSTIIPTLLIGENKTINYLWNPTEYKTYNFTAYVVPVLNESIILNNLVTKLIPVRKLSVYDGMYTNYTFSIFGDDKPSQFTYTYNSGNIFHVDWYMNNSGVPNLMFWDVDTKTRILNNSGGDGWQFDNGSHTPLWIFTDVKIGDEVSIAVDNDGDHTFEVSRELVYNSKSLGLVEAWELVDLGVPNGTAWYEKSTGLLLNGTFTYDNFGPLYNYTFDMTDTNHGFNPSPFTLSTNAGAPDGDGTFDLIWSNSDRAMNYSVYEHTSFITRINGSLISLENETIALTLPLSGYSEGIYYFIIVASNNYGNTLSNCIRVRVLYPTLTIIAPNSTSSWETLSLYTI